MNNNIQISLVMLLVFLVALIQSATGHTSTQQTNSEAIQKRITPIGQVNISEKIEMPSTEPQLTDIGKSIYENNCVVCHDTGAAGSPKLTDKAAWAPRLKQGLKVLTDHVIKGYKLMPAKGACMKCSNTEIEEAVKYIVKQVK